MKRLVKILSLSVLILLILAPTLTTSTSMPADELRKETKQQTIVSSAIFFDFDTASRSESRVDFQNNLPTSTLKLQFEDHHALIRFKEQQLLSRFCQYAFYSFDFTLNLHRSLLLFPFHDFF